MPSPQGSILSNIRPPSSDSNNIGKSLLGALSWKQNYDLNNSEEQRRQEEHELNKSVYQAKTAAARSQASAAGEKAQREQSLQSMQFINRLGKKLLQTDQSQWGEILTPNMPALEQIGYTPQILANMTPEQVHGVVAQTDAALYDFDQDMKRKEFEASRIDADRDYKADRIDADRGYNLDRDKFGADRVDANRNYGIKREELAIKSDQVAAAREKAAADMVADLQSKNFDDETKLRKEFTAVTDEYPKINDAYGRVKASVENPSPAGDLALIFNYMKMLDPSSVVRESEFSAAAKAGTFGQKVKAAVEKASSGKLLAPGQRKDFANRASKLFTEAKRSHRKREKEFTRIAKRNGLDASNVVFDRNVAEMIPEDEQSGNTVSGGRSGAVRFQGMSNEDLLSGF